MILVFQCLYTFLEIVFICYNAKAVALILAIFIFESPRRFPSSKILLLVNFYLIWVVGRHNDVSIYRKIRPVKSQRVPFSQFFQGKMYAISLARRDLLVPFLYSLTAVENNVCFIELKAPFIAIERCR